MLKALMTYHKKGRKPSPLVFFHWVPKREKKRKKEKKAGVGWENRVGESLI